MKKRFLIISVSAMLACMACHPQATSHSEAGNEDSPNNDTSVIDSAKDSINATSQGPSSGNTTPLKNSSSDTNSSANGQ